MTLLHALAVVTSRDQLETEDLAAAGLQVVDEAFGQGYETALAESANVWRKRWGASDVRIEGPAQDQVCIRNATFRVLQMAPYHTDTISVPARAYSYNRYHGLYYWDSETFLLPQYLHAQPEIARNLLAFTAAWNGDWLHCFGRL